jgi:hypothetical protein
MSDKVKRLPTDSIEFVKELYPRLREDDAAIERYRESIDRLPPVVVARGRVLVDGFHRWQAHRREKTEDIAAVDLGNLTDVEILKESVRRNSSHGRQLETKDKRRMADLLYRQGTRDAKELIDLLSVTESTLETYLRDARRDEKEQQQEKAWDLWLNCQSQPEIAKAVGVDQATVSRWLNAKSDASDFALPPDPHMTFDVWNFQKADDDAGTKSHFGRMPPQVVENLLWLFTEPGQIVFDPFAGGGTTIDVAKRMGRRVWASDLTPATPNLPIHKHDITTGWPDDAPKKADFVLLDPPYWQQAKGRYSESKSDLGNVGLEKFRESWAAVVKTCKSHLSDSGHLAFIVSPTQLDDGTVVDHAFEMYAACVDAKLTPVRRIIVPYQTQQATGQQVQWAKDKKRLLKLYRDLGVFGK